MHIKLRQPYFSQKKTQVINANIYFKILLTHKSFLNRDNDSKIIKIKKKKLHWCCFIEGINRKRKNNFGIDLDSHLILYSYYIFGKSLLLLQLGEGGSVERVQNQTFQNVQYN